VLKNTLAGRLKTAPTITLHLVQLCLHHSPSSTGERAHPKNRQGPFKPSALIQRNHRIRVARDFHAAPVLGTGSIRALSPHRTLSLQYSTLWTFECPSRASSNSLHPPRPKLEGCSTPRLSHAPSPTCRQFLDDSFQRFIDHCPFYFDFDAFIIP
jgi:hypothetical protein